MVLKVLRGKILETLELASRPSARSSVLELPVGSRPEPIVRLSKILDYLVDNLYRPMLSVLKECVNKKASGAEATIPDSGIGDSGTSGFC